MSSQSRALLNYPCQVSALPPKPFSNTLKHWLNFKLVGSLIKCWDAVSPNTWLQVSDIWPAAPSAGWCHPQEVLVVMVPAAAPAGRHDFLLSSGRVEATRPEATKEGCRAVPFHKLQQLVNHQMHVHLQNLMSSWMLIWSSARWAIWARLGLLSAPTMQILDNNS